MTLRYATVCSGIEGFGLGFDRAGMECVYQCEIDKQCRTVLARHWPNVERGTDVNDEATLDALVRLNPELLAFGFPCQDLSVAGRRAGLAGKRSGLFFRCCEIVAACAPRWVCVENVSGLLSSNGGRDMGTVVGALVDLGYGLAWRVLDAQWFGVAQRRRRVFIVGHLGDVRRSAEILFERDSLPWDSPPRRAERERVAASLTPGAASGSGVNRPGRRREDDVNIFLGPNGDDVAHALSSRDAKVPCSNLAQATLIAHTLRGEGFDASEGGTGRGTPLIPAPFFAIQERASAESDTSGPGGAGFQRDIGYTLEARHHAQSVASERTGVRRAMPVECLRMQGFPDDWLDGLGLSDSAKYRMIGNSVVPQVAEWIGRRIVTEQRP